MRGRKLGSHFPHSEETKRNIGLGNKGKKYSEKAKKKISESLKEYYISHPEDKKKISERMKIRARELGLKPPSHLGIKHSEETKRKMSEKAKLRIGEKSNQWLGGKSFELYTTDWTDDLRDVIRKRDSYVCRICGIHQEELEGLHKKLDIHHIDYDKKNCDPKNLITLCKSCHMKTNSDREYWIEYFIKYF